MLINCPIGKVASGENNVPVTSFLSLAPKGTPSSSDIGQNRLYALTTRQEYEAFPDIMTSLLKLFSHDVYYLLNLGSTLSYVTLFMAVHFGFGLEFISDTFLFLPW